MTSKLKAVPRPLVHTFYGIRSGKGYRLAGKLPEIINALVDAGAPLSDVMCFADVLEQHAVDRILNRAPRPLDEAWADTAHAEHEVDLATLHLAAHPNDKACIEAACEALNRMVYAAKLEVATLVKSSGASL